MGHRQMFSFSVVHREPGGRARRGTLVTPHGIVQTPAFMPVGTVGAVKGVAVDRLARAGTQIVLANTYHLFLRPTAEVVAGLGGLHRFMGWSGPILTDSGGYQVFSLGAINSIDDDGVTFQSHIDGARVRLSPEKATAVQNALGADIIMTLDQCPPWPCDRPTLLQAVERSVRWAHRCKEAHGRDDQWLFAIVQGGDDHEQRRICAARLTEVGFDGYAVGGLSVGEPHERMLDVLDHLEPHLPGDQPRYLMGVGMPRDLYAGVRAGMDLFDCVLPTRNGRNAQVFTASGLLRMRNAVHRLDDRPLESGCACYACSAFSRGYIRHLFASGEMLGPMLASIHNLHFYHKLMARMRDLIPRGELTTIPREFPVVRSSGRSSDL